MPDTDARLARLYDSLKAPAAGSRAPLGPYGFSGIAGSIWPYLTLSERLFRSAPVGPSRRHSALCTASQSGDQLEFGGHVARLRGLRQSAGNARRQRGKGASFQRTRRSVSPLPPPPAVARAPPTGRSRTAEEHDEVPPFHSITLSALASSVSGTVSPSAFAVLRLTDNSNLEA
jgi:hypothetical protein